jgi:hypothetical protein
MSVSVEQQNKNSDTQAAIGCHVCATIKGDLLLSCANFRCENKVHVGCAVRPEGTRLHFCSRECVVQYWNR